jgi:hypothetical protein
MDLTNVRQKILLELWDSDYGRDDFLGECWLPPLGTMHPHPRRYVIPVRNAPHVDASKSSHTQATRVDSTKNLAEGVECKGNLHIEAGWIMPAEPPTETGGMDQSLEDKLAREEKIHTGKLYIKILKAENLRGSDGGATGAMSLIKSSKLSADPYVTAYQLNEVNGQWKVKDTTVARETGTLDRVLTTKTKKGTLNPEWNEEFSLEVRTGKFEERTKAFRHRHALTSRGKKDVEAELFESMLNANDIRMYFGDPERATNFERGARHGIDVFLGDTVRQFKAKLLRACQIEAEMEAVCGLPGGGGKSFAPRKTPNMKAEDYKAYDPDFQRMCEAVKVTFNHAVTVFVPSDRLRSLFNQARSQAHEYRMLYKLEEEDPAFWQPLDPMRTFGNYASTYGFGLSISSGAAGQNNPAQRLRISEANAEYKMRNPRYRSFEEETLAATMRVDEADDANECFGHGLYVHTGDGDSTEWRPVLAAKPEGGSDTQKRKFTVQWLYSMAGKDPTELTASTQIDEESVILAPRLPKMMGTGTLSHLELLEEAPAMRKEGLSDHDIAAKLNEKLKAKFQLNKEDHAKSDDKLLMPALITVGEVQHHFKRLEHEGEYTPEIGKHELVAPGVDVAGSQAPAASSASAPGARGAPPGGQSSGPPMRQGMQLGAGVGPMTTDSGGPSGSSMRQPLRDGGGGRMNV